MKFGDLTFSCLFLLLGSLFLVEANLNDAKKNGLKNLENQVENIKKLTADTSLEVEKREENIKIITKHEREFGDGIIGKTNFEVVKTAKSAYMMANLLGSSNDVFRCIEYREREALDENDKYYSQRFLEPGRDYESRAEQYQRNLIKSWKDGYYKSIEQYGKIYQRATSDVQKATSEANVSSIVRQFEQTTKEMADIITSVLQPMTQTHIQVLRLLDELVNNLQQYARYRVEETGKAIQKCFPRLYDRETFIDAFIY